MPFLARYYRYAFQRRGSRTKELLLFVPLRRLFVHYLHLCGWPRWGSFEFERFGARRAIDYDARNVQFHALFGWHYHQGYEPEVALLLDALLAEGGTFYDIGSNWGYFALYAASRRRSLTVHAFEPHPKTFRDLAGCVAQAGLKEVVHCHNFALSAADGEALIHVPDYLHSGQAEVSKVRGIPIVTRRLDSLRLASPDFIKMDVEGHEIEVLRGAESTLRQAQPFVVFESKRDYGSPARSLDPLFFLQEIGYRLFQAGLQRNQGGRKYVVPFGYQHGLGQMQPIESNNTLCLTEVIATQRFLFGDDLNLVACHRDRFAVLAAAFGG